MPYMPRARINDFAQDMEQIHQSAQAMQVKPRQVSNGMGVTDAAPKTAGKPASNVGSTYRKR